MIRVMEIGLVSVLLALSLVHGARAQDIGYNGISFSIEVAGQSFNVQGDNRTVIIEGIEFLEDIESNFAIILNGSIPDGSEGKRFEFLRIRSDPWRNDPNVGNDTGIVTFTPTNEDAMYEQPMKMGFLIEIGSNAYLLTVYLYIVKVNDPPVLAITPGTPSVWMQHETIRINLTASDPESDDLYFDVNMDREIGWNRSVVDQLRSPIFLMRGIDWDLNATTGDFWFRIENQSLWLEDGVMLNSREITLVFSVEDGSGAICMVEYTLTLIDVNQPPETPKEIHYRIHDDDPTDNGIQGLTVELWVEPVPDEDMDPLRYLWSFSDGNQMQGRHINYTFITEGTKTVMVRVDDGNEGSDDVIVSFVLVKSRYRGDQAFFYCEAGPDQRVIKGSEVNMVGDAGSNTGITRWTWSFYDGRAPIVLDGNQVVHEFTVPGRYEVTLTVVNGENLYRSDTMFVEVEDPDDGVTKLVHVLWIIIPSLLLAAIAAGAYVLIKHRRASIREMGLKIWSERFKVSSLSGRISEKEKADRPLERKDKS